MLDVRVGNGSDDLVSWFQGICLTLVRCLS